MADGVLLLAAFASGYLGFAMLALAMPRHWQQVSGNDSDPAPSGAHRTRLLAGSLLAVALVLALLRDGPGFGTILWVVMLGTAAATVALTLTWRSAWLQPLARLIDLL